MNKKEIVKRYILLVIGVFFIGLGIALSKHSDLGISPVSSVANILSIKFPVLTVGTWLMISNCAMIIAQIVILKRDFKPIELLQFPISLILGLFTDLCMMIVTRIPAEIYLVRLLLVIGGITVLSFGIALTLISDTVMNVGEALVAVIAKKLSKSFGGVKVIFDICCVSTSVILSLLFFNFKIYGTREGTVITACLTGFIIKWLMKYIKKPIERIVTA